jgi:hypothetical protein
MSFLTPLFLLGALAVAGPIIYHLIRQTTRERTLFSSLMFLLPSPPRISKRHRIEHLLLLILRCLALLLLALGFARPFLTQTELNDPTAAQPKRIVVLLDRSASMRRDGIWTAAQERVEAVVRRAGPVDQLSILTFDRQAAPILTFDEWNQAAAGDRVALAMSRVKALTPGWAGTHLGNGLIGAAEALGESESRAKPGPRQIFLVSDLQTGSRLDTLQAYEWPKGVELYLEPVKARTVSNAGLQLVAEAADSTRAANAPIRVRVTNAAESKVEQFKLGWVRTGAGTEFVGAPVDAYVSPGQSRIFNLPLPAAGANADRIALRGDDDDFDNTVAVIPPTQQKASVLWLGNDAAGDPKQLLFFVRRAFGDSPRVAVQINAKPASTAPSAAELQAANLIFVGDVLAPAAAAAVREQVAAGKVVIAVPKTPEAATAIGALLGQPAFRAEEAKPKNYAMFAEIDFGHPLFTAFNDPRFSDFTKIHIWHYRKFDAAAVPGARVVAKFDSGDPAVLDVPIGQGRVFVLATGWQPEDSQLAISSKFVPLLWSWLEIGGGITNAVTQFSVGDAVTAPPGVSPASVRLPDATTVPFAATAASFTQTAQPGIYEFAGGARPVRFAVNLDPNESRTTPLDAEELERLGVPVVRAETAAVAPGQKSQTMLQGMEAESRQKLWRWFIAATLAVLLVESALAGWTARKSVKTAEVSS